MIKLFSLLFVLLVAGCVQNAPEAAVDVKLPADDAVSVAEEPEPPAVPEPEAVLDNFSSAAGLHWTHMPVTYSISNERECGSYEARKIGRAFESVALATNGTVHFEKISGEADIVFTCSFIEGCYELVTDIDDDAGLVYRYERICAHSKGVAKTAILGNTILGSEIEMFGLAGFSETSGRGTSGFYIGSCGHATTEIHELLHAFGFGHSEDNSSIMYYAEDAVGTAIQKEGTCLGKRKAIDAEIAGSLVETYRT